MSRYFPNRSFLVLTVLASLTGGLISCSQYSTRPISKGYHNLNAHFNAYIIARDQIDAAEQILFKTRQENYNQLLPILLPVDSMLVLPVKPQLDDAIKKASLVPERHQNSKWVDNSYTLIGRARLLKQDLPNAIEVFKYVNTKGTDENDKHEALVGLMRAYVEAGDYPNALNVAEYLRTQPLNKVNTRTFYLTKAYLHQRKGEYVTAVGILDATFPVLKKGESTARLHLIAGQLYDLIGQPNKAVDQYREVLRARPTYDQSFYANLYAIQSNGLTGDQKRVAQSVATFETMLNDRKNADLKDKIYFTMGLLEARSGRIDQAIRLYSQSIQAAGANTTQVPFTYQEIGRLYFEKKADYPKAKVYYDSALALLPKQSPDYAAAVTRKKTLDEFVEYRNTIRTDDSLLTLAQLEPAALDKVLEGVITKREKEDKEQAALAQQIVERASAGNFNAVAGATNSTLPPNERWVLYNPVALSQGRQEFSVRWGNRQLEDNWRRSSKESSESVAATNSPLNGGSAANGINPNAALPTTNDGRGSVAGPETGRKAQKDALRSQIPFTREAQVQANQRIENALYKLGKLYKFQLNQPADAIPTFEQLLVRYPNTLPKPEVYYLLHLSNEQLGKASNWKDKLLAEYPNTSYARLSGRAVAQSTDSEAQAQRIYTAIYELYKANNLTEALARAENAAGSFSGTQVEDKLALLRVMLIGRLKGVDVYRQVLNEFMRDYPASKLLPRAREMQAAANHPTANIK
ncbi:tetratricopeptide repeat protein [Spirosoma utsteinense]|uniref:Tetratricopeptide (TPR) repeat protein n=1 Tax=Spirosoma utsteinense TaxID=2585773 RepID=A0ABR6WBL0_9BACT|nr:tetratricopeptide repeat protein [Spirosoma utsteinense]MBC3786726.1 tetratricopeptide (TPR) repeat protein [Spirosoma utsteinense]MBC3793332.1 tetratricopeptide (TPR) repeat protein [Spirosoma utsteinense]